MQVVIFRSRGFVFTDCQCAYQLRYPKVSEAIARILARPVLRLRLPALRRRLAPDRRGGERDPRLGAGPLQGDPGARVAPSALPGTSDIYSFSPLDWAWACYTVA